MTRWFSSSGQFERLRKVPVTSVPSKTAFADRTLERDDLSPEARKQITRLRDQWSADEEIVTRRPGVCKRLDCKPTHGRDLERSNKIDSFLAGTVRLIHVDSIYEYLIQQILASFPLNEAPLKAAGGPVGPEAKRSLKLPGLSAVAAAPPVAKRGRGRPRKIIPELAATTAD
jgi:hypothetical protein